MFYSHWLISFHQINVLAGHTMVGFVLFHTAILAFHTWQDFDHKRPTLDKIYLLKYQNVSVILIVLELLRRIVACDLLLTSWPFYGLSLETHGYILTLCFR